MSACMSGTHSSGVFSSIGDVPSSQRSEGGECKKVYKVIVGSSDGNIIVNSGK